jgi:hypothetical protein
VETFWPVAVTIFFEKLTELQLIEEFAGTDGVKIWDLGTMKEVTISRHHTRERTQISYLCWITHPHDAALDTLCYGNVFGYLVFLQRPQDAVSVYYSHFV